QRVQVDFGLFENDRATGRRKVRKNKYRQDLGNANSDITKVTGHAIAMDHQLIAAGTALLSHLQPLRHLHARQPLGAPLDDLILSIALEQGTGQQSINGRTTIAAHLPGLGLVPRIVALRLAPKRSEVIDAL